MTTAEPEFGSREFYQDVLRAHADAGVPEVDSITLFCLGLVLDDSTLTEPDRLDRARNVIGASRVVKADMRERARG